MTFCILRILSEVEQLEQFERYQLELQLTRENQEHELVELRQYHECQRRDFPPPQNILQPGQNEQFELQHFRLQQTRDHELVQLRECHQVQQHGFVMEKLVQRDSLERRQLDEHESLFA
jgi:hypothetical protein